MSKLDELADDLKRAVGGPPAEQSRVVNGIIDVLFSRGPGLSGIIEMIERKGFANQASSWVGRGENLTVSSNQVEQMLGSDLVDQIALKSELPRDKVLQKLTVLLPTFVDKLTPEGAVPEENILQQMLTFLRKRFSQGTPTTN